MYPYYSFKQHVCVPVCFPPQPVHLQSNIHLLYILTTRSVHLTRRVGDLAAHQRTGLSAVHAFCLKFHAFKAGQSAIDQSERQCGYVLVRPD